MQPLLEWPPRPRSKARRRPSSSSLSSLPPVLQSLVARTLAAMAPPSTMTVSEWADAWRMLSPEASAEPGLWDTGRAAYLRGAIDAISEPGVSKVVVAKGSQVGFTECLNNILGFYIDQDPAPILIVQPN